MRRWAPGSCAAPSRCCSSAGREAVRAEVHAMKQLTEAHLRQAGRTWGEVKLGEGSIRDVEFVAQYLQLAYGGRNRSCAPGTRCEALARLAENGYLTSRRLPRPGRRLHLPAHGRALPANPGLPPDPLAADRSRRPALPGAAAGLHRPHAGARFVAHVRTTQRRHPRRVPAPPETAAGSSGHQLNEELRS